jgi:hypothetical protein
MTTALVQIKFITLMKLAQITKCCHIKPLLQIKKSVGGIKVANERVTVAACSNASGTHKLPLFVTGTTSKPRAFKNLNLSSLPVYYRAQMSAWMDATLFTEWFHEEFLTAVSRHLNSRNLLEKVLLVPDNAPSHPNESELKGGKKIKKKEGKKYKSRFLPANVTSLIQPMDQGIIESLKRRHRQKFVGVLLDRIEKTESGNGLVQAIKTISIKEVIYMIEEAWDKILPTTLY